MRFGLVVFLLMTISACSNVPKNIKSSPASEVQLNQVLANKQNTEGKSIRWGGEIVEIENTAEVSMIQVVQFPLNHYGKPMTDKNSLGRFMARTTDFFDPVVYKAGSLITFTGNATTETTQRPIDEKQVILPIVDVTDSYRWQAYEAQPSTIYYDPFFHPYYGSYYNRWYGRPWYGPRFGYRYYYH